MCSSDLLGGGLMMTMLTNYIRESMILAFQEVPKADDFVLPPSESVGERSRVRAFFKAKANGQSDAIQKLRMSPGITDVNGDNKITPGVQVNSARYRSPLGVTEKMVLQQKNR